MKYFKPLFVFYFLIFYIFASYFWWAYLLVSKNNQIYQEQKFIIENHIAHSEQQSKLEILENKTRKQRWMIVGEGIVFILLISIGAIQIRQSFINEMQLNKQQNNFLLSVTHELRSPLASIQLALQTIRGKRVNEEQGDKLMKNSLQDVDRLKVLVENILVTTKIETHQQQFTHEEINLSELIVEICKHYRNRHGFVHPLYCNADASCYLQADPVAIQLIISNLIDNAAKYSPSESTIEVLLHKMDKNVSIVVKDKGVGISPEEQKNIFKKFYRIGTEETRTARGTGLGLYLVKQLVAMYKGTIQVHSELNQGSKFVVSLPILTN